MSSHAPNGDRVLIVRVGAMGDVLHALPAVAALRQQRPELPIGWAVDQRWAPLLVDESGRGPVVSRAHLAATRMWSEAPFSARTVRSVLALRQELQNVHYQRAVDLQGTLRSAVIGRLAGTGSLSGYADPREGAARLLYGQRLPRSGTHVVEQGAALLGEALGIPLQPIPPELPRTEAAEDWVERAYGDFSVRDRIALLAPTAGWGAKQWPAERFGALALRLAEAGFEVLLNSTGMADMVCRQVAEASEYRAQGTGCGVAELIALCRRAAVVVGGDSGPLHLAAALGTPVVGLYGPTDPARNGPWGPGPKRVLRDAGSITSHKRVAEPDPGLLRIGVDAVLRAALEVTGQA